MKRIYKRGALIVFVTALFMLTAFPVFGVTGERYIYDEANLLTDEEEMELENLARKVRSQLNVFIAIITKEDGTDVADYASEFYQRIAAQGITDALILTVDMEVREFYFVTHNRADELLYDDELDELYDTLGSYLSAEDFFTAFHAFISAAHDYMLVPDMDESRTGEGYSANPISTSGGTTEDNIFYLWWVQLIIAGLIAAGIVGYMAYTAGGKVTVTEGTYLDHATSKIRSRRDIYLRTVVTKTKRTKSSNHSGGGFGGFSGGSSSSRRGSF